MISKLHIQNFKCLRDVTVELNPLTVLIGKNDTGKTSLLEAVEALGGVVQAAPAQLDVARFAWRGADPPSIGWEVEVARTPRNRLHGRASYRLRVSPSAKVRDGLYVDDEHLSIEGIHVGAKHDNLLVRDELPANESKRGDERLQTAVSSAWHEQGKVDINRFAQAITTSALYRLNPARLAEPATYAPPAADPNAPPSLAADGYGLPVLLDYILGTDRAAFEQIEQEIVSIAPYVKALRMKLHRLPEGMGKSLWFELRSGGDLPATLASQGVMLFLAYLALVHAPASPSVLLVEEPENGVHPRQLQRIAGYLTRLADPSQSKSAVQIITATHSPYLLDLVPPDAVLVFGRRPNGETVVAPLLSLPGVQQRLDSGFSLGEMWFNVGEDRLLDEILK